MKINLDKHEQLLLPARGGRWLKRRKDNGRGGLRGRGLESKRYLRRGNGSEGKKIRGKRSDKGRESGNETLQ